MLFLININLKAQINTGERGAAHSGVVHPRGDVGEEAGGPQRPPEERGGVPETAGRPADGNAAELSQIRFVVKC